MVFKKMSITDLTSDLKSEVQLVNSKYFKHHHIYIFTHAERCKPLISQMLSQKLKCVKFESFKDFVRC